MGAKPTIADVAKRAGMSKTAVSFVFNNRPGISDESRNRILEAAYELGWQPDSRARALVRKRIGALGLIIRRDPTLIATDPFFPQFVAGVETGLSEHGYALMLQVVTDAEEEANAYASGVQEGRVDGFFLTDLRVNDPRLQQVEDLGVPAAVLGPNTLERPGIVTIESDDAHGIRDAITHLHNLGHTNIGHIAGPDDYIHTASRENVWRDTLTELGLPVGPIIRSNFTGDGGTKSTGEMLDLADPPTAIVYGNDLMAIAGISTAVERGLRVPHDLSIVGFDDVPLAPYISPPLTTVRQDAIEWGRVAALKLIALVEGSDVSPPAPLQAKFIVRESTAPRPTR